MFAKRLFREKLELTILATEKRKGFIFPVEIIIFLGVFLVLNLATVIPSFVFGLLVHLLNGPQGTEALQAFMSDPLRSTMLFLPEKKKTQSALT